jgi:Rrf2 family iron-sulfur cluster assembly transcriptional regulator
MVLSKACSYGILASLYMARKEEGKYISIREISNDLDISFHFLTKILQTLTEEGLIVSLRGPKGGVALAKDADSISLFDIITAIDGNDLFNECILGLPGCGHAKPCPMHDHWQIEREKLKVNFNNKSLADIADKVEEFKYRLSMKDL